MPMYEFESKDGERLEEYFSMETRPGWGEKIRRKGKTFTRVVERYSPVPIENEHIAYPLPRWHPDAPYHIQSGPQRGLCAFTSKAQRQEFMAKNPRFGWDRTV